MSQQAISTDVEEAHGRSKVHRATHQGQRICGSDRKGTFFFKGKPIQSAELLYWHLMYIITDVITEFASTWEFGFGQAQKTGLFTNCPALSTSCHTKCSLCFFNTTVSKDNLETKSHGAWLGSWWKITDYFRASLLKAALCFWLGWREVRGLQAGLSDWLFAHWPAVVP